MVDFDKFTRGMGLDKYPFSVFTAEEEKDFLRAAFVKPLAYSPAIQAAKDGKNIFLYGERGTGKTALLFELMTECSKTAYVAQASDFSGIPRNPSQSDVYSLYVSTLATHLFKKLLPKLSALWGKPKLTREDKVLLSYLLSNHTTTLSRAALQKDILRIQHSRMKRWTVGTFNFFRGMANQAAGATVDAVSDLFRQSFGLPTPEPSDVKDYFQRIDLRVDADFDEAKANLLLLQNTVELCKKVGLGRLTIVLDRIDEDSRMSNDSDLIADFLRPFLTENEIFYSSDLQFVFSIWSIPFQKVKSVFRINKFCVEQVEWRDGELLGVLDTRLQHHSAGKVASHTQIIEDVDFFKKKVLPLANGNPRDLWQLMNRIIREQYQRDALATKISVVAMEAGMHSFVQGFTYFEYYPRKSDARANTMDVYAYIAHLCKLDTLQFTSNSLSVVAKTGSSTPNYLVGMESIGLIRKCEAKGANGAVLYEIKDPKVRFAVENRIEIRRDA